MLRAMSNLTLVKEVTNSTRAYVCNVTAEKDGDYQTFLEYAQFTTGLVILPVILVIGIVGNIISLIVLSDRAMLTSCNIFLTALAVADLIKLFNDALYFILQVLFRIAPQAGNVLLGHMYPVSHYLFNQSVCVASWLTVSVAVERYISVCHPMSSKRICTPQRARIVSAFMFVCMSAIAIPCALSYQKKLVYQCETQTMQYEIELTLLGRSQGMKGYVWFQNLLRAVIPLFILVWLNSLIIHALRKERIKNKKIAARNRITLMLITVIIVFLICTTPDALMSTIFGYGYWNETNLVRGIREITDLLLSVNSGLNFIVYCCFSKVFRTTFLKRFGCERFIHVTYSDAATQMHQMRDVENCELLANKKNSIPGQRPSTHC